MISEANRRAVRLKKIRFKAYRSCKDVTFSPRPDLSVLIGRNGSGKTNLLQGIRLLARARPHSSSDDDERLPLTSQITCTFDVDGKEVLYRSSIAYNSNERNQDRITKIKNKWNLKNFGLPNRFIDNYIINSLIRFRSSQPLRQSSEYLVLSEGGSVFPITPELKGLLKDSAHADQIIEAIRRINQFRERINYYSASLFSNGAECPSSFEIDEDGDFRSPFRQRAHGQFLFDLFTSKEQNPDEYERFLSLVGGKTLNLIDRVSWKTVSLPSNEYAISNNKVVRDKRKKTLVVPFVEVNGSKLLFNQLSEGTFRSLALLFYVITAKDSLLLLEEPEIGIHHGLLKSIIEALTVFVPGKQIIFSTHSEVVLDQLQPNQIFAVTNSKGAGTLVDPIGQKLGEDGVAALHEYLSETGNLGEFLRHSGY